MENFYSYLMLFFMIGMIIIGLFRMGSSSGKPYGFFFFLALMFFAESKTSAIWNFIFQ